MIRFGVHCGPQDCTMAELRHLWALSEQLGFDWISTWDHFYAARPSGEGECFEAVATHAALAATTTRPRVGCLVYSAGYRHPAVLANAAITMDHLSGGRFEMGLGAGWHQPEYDGYGIAFEAPGVRLRRMAESIEVVRGLFTQERFSYSGEFFTLAEARCEPKPVQPGGPRIWVGARSPRALALAGRLGDAWNIAFASPTDFATKRDIVLANAADPDRFQTGVNLIALMSEGDLETELRRRFGHSADIIGGTLHGSSTAVAEQVQRYVDAGATWINLAMRAPFDLAGLERFALEVMSQFERPDVP
jgi:alkanesulfonate monooxygenase SsuD/methylene tetrahydromethanopterin reductase-like flavin-dependent oxidoreductase (luciferase family)